MLIPNFVLLYVYLLEFILQTVRSMEPFSAIWLVRHNRVFVCVCVYIYGKSIGIIHYYYAISMCSICGPLRRCPNVQSLSISLFLDHHHQLWKRIFNRFYDGVFFSSPAEWKLIDAELIQNRFLVGFGPSLNTCPKCEPHFEQVTSVRTISGFAISSSRFPPT